ncbi:hypothetical protein GGX14DRAFT_464666 [Mycena pura]|uniref:Uncharacterized protein n=1 Tax=Mycena pura TaxID=153505 RepID=A0AAD6V323_9AGAR|nr:hypothetical protein GGX14DRAFT_464666 [Mycena pura]
MPRRRQTPNAHLDLSTSDSNMPTDSPKPSRPQRHRSQPSVGQPTGNLGMSPEARYNHNLKVLRRRDPSIISIFDQFTHVCVYHHNGETWEKNGFEGSMFLYERDTYPPYGFYILNRMGMDDYAQRLYPEDITGPHGTYLMLRSYPDFTTRRMSKVLSQHDTNNLPDKFSEVYFPPNLDKITEAEKGRVHTVGLWMFPTDAREPMIDVMMRVQSYVKRNTPYPEQFRYGPGRPPPPNPHLRTTSPSPPLESQSAPSSESSSLPNGNPSELDRLFAKLAGGQAASASAAVCPSPSRPKSKATPSRSTSAATVTVASLFATVNGANIHDEEADAPQSPVTGIPLLDSIFASATPPNAAPTIHSPTPTASTVTPQILNHEVITSLLGLPPSRSASASSAAHSDSRSHSTSREGDNEYEESPGSNSGGDRVHLGSDGFSESSTVLDPEADLDEELPTAGTSAGRPLLSASATRTEARHDYTHVQANTPRVNGKGRLHGDVTPRAPVPPSITNGRVHKPHPPVPPPTSDAMESTAVRPSQVPEQAPIPTSSTFAASSELWPYSRAPVDDTAEDGDIVELDFADTSALSDPDAFLEVQRRARRNPNADSADKTPDGASAGKRGKGRRKGRKERAADIEHQRSLEAFRLSIDPANVRERVPSVSSSRSASASPDPQLSLQPPVGPTPFLETETPTTARPSKMQTLSGLSVNGSGPAATLSPRLEPMRAKASILSAIPAQAQKLPSRMERNEFIRELLTLIHTDKAFVDTLWQDYMTRFD